MDVAKKNINKDFQLIIRKSVDNIVEIHELPIIKLLDQEFSEFLTIFENINITAAEIINKLNQDIKLKVLSQSFNYCLDISKPYEGIQTLSLQAYPVKFPNIENDMTLNQDEKQKKINDLLENQRNSLKIDLNNRINAYRLENMYLLCLSDKSILSFSHRKRGWSIPKYFLTENFSFELKTNFGYGSASYFYTKIQYKEIDVLPYSDWINYKYAHLFEIIGASSKHYLNQESWNHAFEYVINACRIAVRNEKEFIEIYVISECEKLVIGLQKYLSDDKFTYTSSTRIYTDYYKHGENLVEYKAHKISGSIDFISCIFKFSKHIDVSSFIHRIINFNEQIQPVLIKEIELTKVEITKVKDELTSLNDKIQHIKPKYLEIKTNLSQELFSETKMKVNEIALEIRKSIENKFFDLYPEYRSIIDQFDIFDSEYKEKLILQHSLEKSFNNLITYNEKITSFIDTEKPKYHLYF